MGPGRTSEGTFFDGLTETDIGLIQEDINHQREGILRSVTMANRKEVGYHLLGDSHFEILQRFELSSPVSQRSLRPRLFQKGLLKQSGNSKPVIDFLSVIKKKAMNLRSCAPVLATCESKPRTKGNRSVLDPSQSESNRVVFCSSGKSKQKEISG